MPNAFQGVLRQHFLVGMQTLRSVLWNCIAEVPAPLPEGCSSKRRRVAGRSQGLMHWSSIPVTAVRKGLSASPVFIPAPSACCLPPDNGRLSCVGATWQHAHAHATSTRLWHRCAAFAVNAVQQLFEDMYLSEVSRAKRKVATGVSLASSPLGNGTVSYLIPLSRHPT